jgi:hypothetical protein
MPNTVLSSRCDRSPTVSRLALRAVASLFVATTLHAQTPDSATLAALRWRSIGPVNMAWPHHRRRRRSKESQNVLRHRSNRRRVEDDQRRHDIHSAVGSHADRVDRRYRDRAQRREGDLCRHGEGNSRNSVAPWLGRLQVGRWRNQLAVRRSREDPTRWSYRRSSDKSEHRIRGRRGRDMGVEPRARAIQDGRRWEDVGAEQVHQRQSRASSTS